MIVLLLSVRPLPDQCLLHLYLTHKTDLPSTCPRPQLVIILIKGMGGGAGGAHNDVLHGLQLLRV